MRATREVVLSGGAVNSPQLLMLSGIGPADHLREVGVDVVHDLPGVGGGLQDHPLVPVGLERALGQVAVPRRVAVGLRAVVRRPPRPADLQPGRGGAVHPVDARSCAEPDLQFHFLPVKFWKQAEVDPDVDAFTAAVVLVHVHSRGSVRLRSADPTWAPAIDAGYLTDERDLDALVSGVEKAREIASAGPLASVLADEWSPGGTVHGRDALRASVAGHPRVAVPPGRLLPDGHRRRRPSSTRSCGCTASRGCGSSTPRSCRRWCAATPTRRRSCSPSGRPT